MKNLIKQPKQTVDLLKAKLYIIHCEDIKIANEFMNNIRNHIPRTVYISYNELKFDEVNKMFSHKLSKYNKDDVKIAMKIANIANKYNKIMFEELVYKISNHNFNRTYIFVILDNLSDVIRITRYYKRPNYITLRINNTSKLPKKIIKKVLSFKYDHKFDYHNSEILKVQSSKFINKNIPTLKRL